MEDYNTDKERENTVHFLLLWLQYCCCKGEHGKYLGKYITRSGIYKNIYITKNYNIIIIFIVLTINLVILLKIFRRR